MYNKVKSEVRMKKIILMMVMGFLTLTGCAKEFDQISAEAAKEMMETQNNVVILDVRTQEEFQEGHIPNAICIPNESIQDQAESVLKDKDQTILVYCRSGNRSKQASQKLAKLGYTQIKEFGGIQNWPYEIEN